MKGSNLMYEDDPTIKSIFARLDKLEKTLISLHMRTEGSVATEPDKTCEVSHTPKKKAKEIIARITEDGGLTVSDPSLDGTKERE